MRENKVLYITFLMLLLALSVRGQDSIKKKTTKAVFSNSVKKLEQSIDANDAYKTAKNYEELAVVYQKKGDLAKAEAFYKKAEQGFVKLNKIANFHKFNELFRQNKNTKKK